MKDIAKQAGITRQTVSEILNNKFSRVSDATRERVLKIAKDLKFSMSYSFSPSMVFC